MTKQNANFCNITSLKLYVTLNSNNYCFICDFFFSNAKTFLWNRKWNLCDQFYSIGNWILIIFLPELYYYGFIFNKLLLSCYLEKKKEFPILCMLCQKVDVKKKTTIQSKMNQKEVNFRFLVVPHCFLSILVIFLF